MPREIEIQYPSLSSVSQEEIDALKKFEPELKTKLSIGQKFQWLLHKDSKPLGKSANSIDKPTRYFELIDKKTGLILISLGSQEIRDKKDDQPFRICIADKALGELMKNRKG